MKNVIIWNGDSDLANNAFGESYGIDWVYLSKKSSDIIVEGRIISVGDEIN